MSRGTEEDEIENMDGQFLDLLGDGGDVGGVRFGHEDDDERAVAVLRTQAVDEAGQRRQQVALRFPFHRRHAQHQRHWKPRRRNQRKRNDVTVLRPVN